MTIDKYLSYRGDLQAVISVDADLAFVTLHRDRQPTGLYRLDPDKLVLTWDPLPEGGRCLCSDGHDLWVGGSDGRVYFCPTAGGPAPRGPQFSDPILSVALLKNDRLAILAGMRITVLQRADGKVLQTLELPETGTCLAAAPTGDWLVAGTDRGMVLVFEAESTEAFVASASERLHEGAVTALLFQNDDLRFLSAGADLKLLSTHARGNLEPEDRGRGNNHIEAITAMQGWVLGRFFTGSRDSTLKSWPHGQGTRPVTHKDGVARVKGLALVSFHTQAHIVIACEDNTLRICALDAEGKFGEWTQRVHDALASARSALDVSEGRAREKTLLTLAEYGDADALEIIGERMVSDGDAAVRLLAAQLLGASNHPRAVILLEKGLTAVDEAVRTTCFQGLRRQRGDSELSPIDLALKTGKPDLGKLAIQALETLAAKDDQALIRLTGALNAALIEVRQAALMSLEKVMEPASPEPDLWALTAQHADVRRLALIRLYQRHLLAAPKVQSALRWRMEDADSEVRRTAFLLTLATRPPLVQTLRALDEDLHRQISDLEATGPDGRVSKDVDPKPQPKMPRAAKGASLADAAREPLLQATASRALDTCLRGARGLAVLHDERALGLLLQLSREESAQARVEVSWALAALGDDRVLSRLRSLLQDREASVRDAAYSALLRAHAAEPLTAAGIGLDAPHEDVRRRSLQVLLDTLRKAQPIPDAGRGLLARALNDASEQVRREAFKAVLNLASLGTPVEILQFARQSMHADVRREALTEVMAQASEPWAWTQLLSFLHDPDRALRDETLTFAQKKFKDKEIAILDEALQVRFADMRLQAVEGLIRKATRPAQALLVRALNDTQAAVRLRALQALIDADARTTLIDALQSTHEDVRLESALTLARHGLPIALAPLLTQVQTPKPKEPERENDWSRLVMVALEGLGQLGDPTAQAMVVPFLHHERSELRHAAIQALVGMSQPATAAALQPVLVAALQHEDIKVKYRAALSLAFLGDPHAAAIVFSPEAKQVLTPYEILAAACVCKPAGEEQLTAMLDDPAPELRRAPLLVLNLLELADARGTPARLLRCLSARQPRVRLTAARALENFAQPEAFTQFVVEQFNDRDENPSWKVPTDMVRTLAELLAFGAPQTVVRTIALLEHLQPKEQHRWDLAWARHAERYADEIQSLRQTLDRQPRPPVPDNAALRQLAFGAYVGLVREQGMAAQQANLPAIIRVRQTALSRLVSIALAQAEFNAAVRSIALQALGDPNQPVRLQALEALQTLGMDSAVLGAEAIETGQRDLGIKGLELLTDGASKAEGEAVLAQVMLTRHDHLAREAAKLLMTRRPKIAVMLEAVSAGFEDLRQEAIAWLAAEYEQNSDAQHALRQALSSRYQKVRLIAAITLGMKKDPRAFDALVKSLHSPENSAHQRDILLALLTLGDPRTPSALLDRLENDPAVTAPVDALLDAIGQFRPPESVERLLAYGQQRDLLPRIYTVLFTISGHDQAIHDPEDEFPDRRWEKAQYPRHDAVLARLLEHALQRGNVRLLAGWIPAARWARGKEVDLVLALLVHHADANLRNQAVEAIGLRLKKRSGSPEPLLKALRHRDATTQFLAAEKLALAQRADGINILLSAIEYLEDISLRRRAVSALGELGDPRAAELLLKLAGEEGHALQFEAVMALGHFSKSPEAETIFKLLERAARRSDELAQAALKGLRWFNDRAAWQIIRQRAAERSFRDRQTAVEQLAFNDEPATRELLLRMLMKPGEDEWFQETALASARKLWGMEALDPDEALLRSGGEYGIEDALKRVCDQGDAEHIFAILPECHPQVQNELATSLMNRRTLPVAHAQTALDHPDTGTVRLAAHILGRVAPVDAASSVEKALQKWSARWTERRRWMERMHVLEDGELPRITSCLEMLLWAAQRCGARADTLQPLAQASPDDRHYRPVRLAALRALAQAPKASSSVLATLTAAATGTDAEARTLAVEALARQNLKGTAVLSEKILSDRVSFRRLAEQPGAPIQATLQNAASQLHYQGVVLPHLIARHEEPALAAVAANAHLPVATRLGAVEGLAALAEPSAEEHLIALGKNESEPEALRKAAWRGLRRSRRTRQTRQTRQRSQNTPKE